jgi:hypothetical protein
VFWFGDFNYRLNMGDFEVKSRIAKSDWQPLLEADQVCNPSFSLTFYADWLMVDCMAVAVWCGVAMGGQMKQQMQQNAVFEEFKEAPISFAPTYKYDNGTNTYDTRCAYQFNQTLNTNSSATK